MRSAAERQRSKGASARRYPVSDHCDGERFFNADRGAPAGRGWRDVLQWAVSRRPAPWPRELNDPPWPFPETIADGQIAVTFIGHSTFLLRFGGIAILTDPVWARHAGPFGRMGPRRVRAPGLALDRLPKIDLVLLSHNHFDHLDPGTLAAVGRRFAPTLVTPLGNAAYVPAGAARAVHELDWWDVVTITGGARVTAVPAQHFAGRTPFDRNRALWAGFVVEHAGRTVCFAGDSGYGAHFAEIGARFGTIDLALLPIGAYDPRWFMHPVHTDPAEAVQAHRDLRAERSVAMHFGTFRLADEPFDEPVRRLSEWRERLGLAPDVFRVLGVGETALL
ncbi:MAG: MBL fold metallo-hydrolase [Gemmatimonadota bacterium]